MGVQTDRRERISLVGAIAWAVCFQVCAAQTGASWTSESSMAAPALPVTQCTTAVPIPLDQLSLRTRTASLKSTVDPRRPGYPGELHCRP